MGRNAHLCMHASREVSLIAVEEWKVRHFLEHYQLQLNYFEEFGKIIKVHTNNGIFVIKSVPATKGIDFVKNIQQLYQKGYNRIVPIFATVENSYGVIVDHQLWYLMPWLPNQHGVEGAERKKQLLRELARMHVLSAKETTVDTEEQEAHFHTTKERLERQQSFLEEFSQLTERKWYMSPFELQYCAYHQDIYQALNYSIKKLTEWYDRTKEEGKIRVVTAHGKLSLDHFLYAENGYGHFINLEEADEVAAHFDVLPFTADLLDTYPRQNSDILDLLDYYFKFFPWRIEEIMLFSSYLASPERCVAVVEDFFHRKNEKSEIELCRELQLEYWLLKNTEFVIMQLEQRIQAMEAAKKEESEPDDKPPPPQQQPPPAPIL